MERILQWDAYFMGIALISAMRSKDPRTRVGACIVNRKKRIVGIGYNGMPTGCDDAEFPWGCEGDALEQKYLYVVHAELNAILNATTPPEGCTVYTTLFPCNECCKAIIQAGIREVIYLEDKYDGTDSVVAGKRMLEAAGVAWRRYAGETEDVVLRYM